MENFKNLYEIRKTVNFEFKPSSNTQKRVLKNRIKEISILKDEDRNIIDIFNFFNNQNQDLVSQTRKYFKVELEKFDTIFESFVQVMDKIKSKRSYENFRIYTDTAKTKLLGKDFRDCYQEMRISRTKKGKGWDYYYGFNAKTKKPEFRTVRFGDYITVHQLFAFQYNKETKKGKFEEIFWNKIELIRQKYDYSKIEILDFLNTKNQTEKFITKPEILDRLKNMAYCFQDIAVVMNIFCDEGKNGSNGSVSFLKDLENIRKSFDGTNTEETTTEVIRQINQIINPKAHHYKFTLNFKAKNQNTQLSGNDIFLSEKEIQKKLKEEMDKLEKNKKEKSDCQSYISKFRNVIDEILVGKNFKKEIKLINKINSNEKLIIEKWDGVQNKQGLLQNFEDAFSEYNKKIEDKKELDENIASNQNERDNYAVINQLKSALRNSKNTYFGVILEKNGNYFLALENKISDKKLKVDSAYVLKKINNKNNSCQLLTYESLTWKAVEKLCLLPTSSLEGKDDKIIKYWNEFCEGKIIIEKKKDKDKRNLLNVSKIKNYLTEIVDKNNLSKFFDKDEFEKCITLSELKSYFNDICFVNNWTVSDWEEICELDKKGEINLYQVFNKDFELEEYFATSKNDKEIVKRRKLAQEKLGGDFISKQKNTDRKKTLFTTYWNNCFDGFNTEKYRLQPEGKICIRNVSPINDSLRYKEEKILGDFGILFNPISKTIEQKIKNGKERIQNFNTYMQKYISQNEIYVIGLDRGENSLVSYALMKFKKKRLKEDDIRVRFDNKIDNESWVLDEIVEARDLSAVKVFNQKGKWAESEFAEQKEDFYFVKKTGESYDEKENKKDAKLKKEELKKQYPDYKNRKGKIKERVFVLPMRKKEENGVKQIVTGAYAVKILSWKDGDGSIYNYRVAQEIIKEKRLKQLEKHLEYNLINTTEFKNGYVSHFVNFIAKKSAEYNTFISFENLNFAGGKKGNLDKTFGATVYQVIENKLMSKLGYLIQKSIPKEHLQIVPRIQRIDELKEDIIAGDKNNKDYQLGFVQITDETNTSKICPNCGYSKNRYESLKMENGIFVLKLKNEDLQNEDFGIDKSKEIEFKIKDIKAWRYAGVATEELSVKHEDFCKTISDPRQNIKKSKDFIRCVHCGFDSRFSQKNHKKLEKIKSGDSLAAYNIAKRGLEFINKNNH